MGEVKHCNFHLDAHKLCWIVTAPLDATVEFMLFREYLWWEQSRLIGNSR